MQIDPRDLPSLFERRFGRAPKLFRAPGRVNLIGEHTDYNDGFVLPAALDLATYVAIAPRQDRLLHAHSENLNADFAVDLDAAPGPAGDWRDYVVGVALELEKSNYRLCGADMVIMSVLPMGSGLSASAALEAAVGYAMLSVANRPVDRLALAKICQRAENEFVGMRCGVMDQFISCHGVEGSALLLDCRSLEARPIPLDPTVRVLVCNTMVHHQLAGSEYNLRRQDCETAVALLAKSINGVTALRDVSVNELDKHAADLPPVIFKRARHVVTENARVLAAVAALEASDFAEAGRLMNASHESLRDDYEVSCPELDLMVELSRAAPGVFGARMTGGGFGGCTVSLVDARAADRFAESVGPAYERMTGLRPMIFSCYPGPGAGPVAF
ncbi:galactokinase [Methylocystis parvus]|uniref:Galactokinase n=1 Tax=Methylocystis parvus TaxID=134 RepID=A0A6B8M693_9HYPH|nr:galactokinase [Methylocystis parvus]QGM96350.1 galactokinase [Methylocystis parvus]WBJ99812.1 galactokinase [Methylocystis parvus OBBP]